MYIHVGTAWRLKGHNPGLKGFRCVQLQSLTVLGKNDIFLVSIRQDSFEMRHHLCENNLISNKPIQIYKTRAVCRMSIDLGILNSRDSITMDYYCTLWIFPRRMHRWTCNGYKPPYIRATEVCFTVIVIRSIVDRYDVLVLCAFVICNNGVILIESLFWNCLVIFSSRWYLNWFYKFKPF
jgi:hypothetical protein